MPTNPVKSVRVVYQTGGVVFSLIGSENRYPVVYAVEFNTAGAGNRFLAVFAQDPATHLAIPTLGTVLYTGSFPLYLLKITPDWHQIGGQSDGKHVLVTCEYGIQVRGNVTDPSVAPWDRPMYVDCDTVLRPRDANHDAAGHPFTNAAGVPFKTPFKLLEANRRIIIKFAAKVADWDKATAQNLIGTINNVDMSFGDYDVPAWHGRVARISAPQDTWINISAGTKTDFYNITIEIEVINDGVNTAPVEGDIEDLTTAGFSNGDDMGFLGTAVLNDGTICVSDGDDQVLTPCKVYETDSDGNKIEDPDDDACYLVLPVSDPVPLDFDGTQKSMDEAVSDADMYWYIFTNGPDDDWADLDLPSS